MNTNWSISTFNWSANPFAGVSQFKKPVRKGSSTNFNLNVNRVQNNVNNSSTSKSNATKGK